MRYAPSPTGRLHLGNLRTAWISALWAKYLKVSWVVRFEDIDRPRVVSGVQELQLKDLMELGLKPDVLIVQSLNHASHFQRFQLFRSHQLVYPCFCSRKKVETGLQNLASAPHEAPPIYNGICRNLSAQEVTEFLSAKGNSANVGWRIRGPKENGSQDALIARTTSDIENASHFIPAYSWACALDDYDGDYPLLVRAWDLDHVIPVHRMIMKMIADLEDRKSFSPPAVFHSSLVVQNDGHRLEKRTQGVTLDELKALGHTPKTLLKMFEDSFEGEIFNQFEREKIFGEKNKTLPLSQLISIK